MEDLVDYCDVGLPSLGIALAQQSLGSDKSEVGAKTRVDLVGKRVWSASTTKRHACIGKANSLQASEKCSLRSPPPSRSQSHLARTRGRAATRRPTSTRFNLPRLSSDLEFHSRPSKCIVPPKHKKATASSDRFMQLLKSNNAISSTKANKSKHTHTHRLTQTWRASRTRSGRRRS